MQLSSREKVLFEIHKKSYIDIMGGSEDEAIKYAEDKIMKTRNVGQQMNKIGYKF